MVSIKTTKVEIHLTSEVLNELLIAVKEARETTKFIEDPYPDCDMGMVMRIEEDRKRGKNE